MQRPHAIILSATGILVLLAAFAAARKHPPIVTGWAIAGPVRADSLLTIFAARVGEPPDTLGSCGPRRIRLVYVNAPIDLRLQGHRATTMSRVETILDMTDASARDHVAQTLALVAWSAGARADAVDTVSVKLARTAHNFWHTAMWGEYGEYDFVRDPTKYPDLRGVGQTAYPCGAHG